MFQHGGKLFHGQRLSGQQSLADIRRGRRDRILWCLRVLFEVGAQSPRFRTERLRLFPGLGNPLSQSAVVSIHVFDRLKKRSTGSVEVVEYVLLFLVDGEHGLELKNFENMSISAVNVGASSWFEAVSL